MILGRNIRVWKTHPQRGFGVFLLLECAVFAGILLRLAKFAWKSELETYILLIPFVSAYLIHLLWTTAAREDARPPVLDRKAFLLWGGSGALLLAHGVWCAGNPVTDEGSRLFLPMVAFVTSVLGAFLFFCGIQRFRAAAFPLLFLYLMVPIPDPTAHVLRITLQQWSAQTADAMFQLIGTPEFRDGMRLELSGLSIRVAEECSGIQSSLVLLITSLVAGHLFLQQAWSRILLTLIVIPLCVLRNAFRVVSIALLTVHVDRGIIDGPLHHKGGPVFFALALLILLSLLEGLRWLERPGGLAPPERKKFWINGSLYRIFSDLLHLRPRAQRSPAPRN